MNAVRFGIPGMTAICYFLIWVQAISQPSNARKEQSLLVVSAHADDEAVIAPMLARYSREGITVYMVVATDGSWGVRDHAGIPQGQALAEARAKEANCSAEALGIEPPIFLGIEDGSLGQYSAFWKLHYRLDSLIDLLQPDAIVTWDQGGYYGHIDHRMVSNITTELCQMQEAENASDLYYYSALKINRRIIGGLKTKLSQGLTSNVLSTRKQLVTHSISYTETDKEAAWKSFQCYQSQFTLDEMKDLFSINTAEPRINLRAAFPGMVTGSTIFDD